MKKILVIGNSESIFVKDFCYQFINQECIVDVLSSSGLFEIQSARKNYIVRNAREASRSRIGRIFSTQFELVKIINELDSDYDCIVMHFVDFRFSFYINKLLKKTRRLVTVVWGSDFYRTSRFRRLLQKNIYKNSDAIVFTNPATIADFKKNGPTVDGIPLIVARFGLPALDEIKKIRESGVPREKLCNFFGLPSDKLIILAGYNANSAHRQQLIIENFARLDANLRNKAVLVFPLGYGDSATSEKIRLQLQNCKIENYKLLDQFYDFADIAKLRCITDVLVNIQSSDQFSGSMQETLFAGGRVIAGSWLPYAEISRNGARVRYINSPHEVGSAIVSEIDVGITCDPFGSKSICSYIETSSSWAANLKIWKNVMFDRINPVA